MNLIERAKKICLTPKTEWDVIAPETIDTKTMMLSYVAPLAAIGVVAGFIGNVVVGHSSFFGATVRTGVIAGLVTAVFQFALAFGLVFVWSLVIDALAPSFGAEKNKAQALKVATYAGTPVWLASVLNIIPALAPLVFLALLYAVYVMYLGLMKLMKSPEDKALGYAAVISVCMIVLGVVIGAVVAMVGIGGMFASGGVRVGSNSSISAPGSSVTFDKDSALGKLGELGKKMEEANKKMEAAQKSGDQKAQMNAAMESLGTLIGGGKCVDPIGIEQLKPFVPETVGGLPKTSSRTEKTGVAGLMVSKAEATYSDGAGKEVQLDITDSGGASGLIGLAGWMGIQGEKEDQYGSEKTAKIDGRIVHEKISKSGDNEFSIVLGDRFVVSAKGRGVDIAALKGAVTSLDLGKLEALKDVGVQK
ncbi:MAG: YIP1 family protein [Burkholderiales bacterium]